MTAPRMVTKERTAIKTRKPVLNLLLHLTLHLNLTGAETESVEATNDFTASAGVSRGDAEQRAALAQNYRYQEQDAFNFVSSDGNVWAQGRVNWYQGDQRWRIDTIRAEYTTNSWVQLRRNGCLHVKVDFFVVGASVSWPPGVSGQSVSDGFYMSCGVGYSTWVNLRGLSYSSARNVRTTITIGYSPNNRAIRRYQAAHAMWRGFNSRI